MSKNTVAYQGFKKDLIGLNVKHAREILISAVRLERIYLRASRHHQVNFKFKDNFTERVYHFSTDQVKNHQKFTYRYCYVGILPRLKSNKVYIRMMNSLEARDSYQILVNYYQTMKPVLSLKRIDQIKAVSHGVHQVYRYVKEREHQFWLHHKNGVIMWG